MSGQTSKRKKKDTQKHIEFYGMNHVCSYCGTKFNENECPSCCSTQYETTSERLRWDQEQRELQRNIAYDQEMAESASKRYAQKSHNRFITIFFIFFGSVWFLVFASFFFHACAMSQMTQIFYSFG